MSTIDSKHIKETRSPWDQLYYSTLSMKIANVIKKKCASTCVDIKKLHILDAGCGRGETMSALNSLGFSPVGIDINADCVERSRKYGETLVSELMNLDKVFKENQFDLTVCSHVLEHM
jgi:2-polyprenyl-3-methyl-5-hydroxy-6-metoxy-1,4-benzoquinol methylase